MKTEKSILDECGKVMIQSVFDNQYNFIKNDIKDLAETEGYKNLFGNMTPLQKREIENYTNELLRGCLFEFLKIFEENDEFKLIYEEDGQQVNLVEISEMLKAEPIIDNGWIERFSREVGKGE
ncbi:hypothetical protein [Pedobacter sp. CFBP9032]|uniref:hypothetical protein n=1 Tax=Pedobacter sp. CFBP9032 TaxID=3096539 RepID=UPI002A6A0B36|nr:hypothetical protein [Pedobacter sp. CFBP9032]MDY0907825.1 hypothetical protein [Pedobacter sp. CFBP9032]